MLALARSEEGKELAQILARDEGRALAQALARSEDGKELAQILAYSKEGSGLAQLLVENDRIRTAGRALADSSEGLMLARSLANGNAGLAFTQTLAGSVKGRELFGDLADSRAGRRQAQHLVDNAEGRTLTQGLASSSEARALAANLAVGGAGRHFAWGLAASLAGQAVVKGLAGTATALVIAELLGESAEGRELARELAESKDGRNFARDLAAGDEAKALIKSLAGSRVMRDLAPSLIRSSEGSLAEDVMASFGLLGQLSVVVHWLGLGNVAGPALVWFVAGVAAEQTADESDDDDEDQPTQSDDEDPSKDQERQALEVLTDEAGTATGRALEHPLADLDRLLQDKEIRLEEIDERYLRLQASTIRLHVSEDESDRFTIERAIHNIVQRLSELGHVGEGARLILTEIGVSPDELIEMIVESLRLWTEIVTGDWGDPDAPNPADPIERAGRAAEDLADAIDQALADVGRLSKKLDELADDGANRAAHRAEALGLGRRMAQGAAKGIGSESGKTFYKTARIDQILIRFMEAIADIWARWAPF